MPGKETSKVALRWEVPDAYQLAPLEDVIRELAEGKWESMTLNQQEARELVALIDGVRNHEKSLSTSRIIP